MKKKKISNGRLKGACENDGIGYVIENWCSAKDLEDPETARLFEAARTALVALKERLKPYKDDED